MLNSGDKGNSVDDTTFIKYTLVALVVLIGFKLFMQQSCEEKVEAARRDAHRDILGFWRVLHQNAFDLYVRTLFAADRDRDALPNENAKQASSPEDFLMKPHDDELEEIG